MNSQVQEISKARGLFDLPTEIFLFIISHLSRHDVAVCIRINKFFYSRLINRIWDTVEITTPLLFRRFLDLYGSKEEDEKATHSDTRPLARNLHRIRVLKVTYARALHWFVSPENKDKRNDDSKDGNSDGKSSLQELCLEELSVLFQKDPSPSWLSLAPAKHLQEQPPRSPPLSQPESLSIDLRPILNIFQRCQKDNLKRLTIGSSPFEIQGQLLDQARVLAAIPPGIEKLSFQDLEGRRLRPISRDVIHAMLDILSARTTPKTSPRVTFRNLKKISLVSCGIDCHVLLALLGRCPVLEELHYDGLGCLKDDAGFAQLILKGSPTGWKTLSFRNCNYLLDIQSIHAILEHAATLENFRSGDYDHFSSSFLQQLLCSAPRLKRFDCIPVLFDQWRRYDHQLLASDILLSKALYNGSSDGWVYLELESFKCLIGGIPRPDLQISNLGKPLKGDLFDRKIYSVDHSRKVQRAVLAQFGKLTKLREITLGQDNVKPFMSSDDDLEPTAEDEFAHQYTCPMMTLDTGLDQLKDLKGLRRLHLHKMSHRQGEPEEHWMKENWPEYGKESRDTFWTSRDHSVWAGRLLKHSKVRRWRGTVPCSGLNDAGISLIKKYEGFVDKPRFDPVGLPTVGYGHRCQTTGCQVPFPFPLTESTASQLLNQDIPRYTSCLGKALNSRVILNQNQWAALTSWTFNEGCGAMASSTLVARLNAGQDPNTVAEAELPQWKMAGGKVLRGLVARRAAEVALFKTGNSPQAFPKCT
ncbi:hypothetical protein BGZ83_001704 [Gryganskiella cystojenkinii]|nr:hypothetical protein BGZ83_001704 [Gryganskiella cystojenkinii]